MDPKTCPIRRCGGTLTVEKTHTQDGTGDRAVTTCCTKNKRHRFFIVEKVGVPIRLTNPRW